MSAERFREKLLESGLLVDGRAAGLYFRSFRFEAVVRGIEAYFSRAGSDVGPRQLFLPPILSRSTVEQTGYLSSFPDLLGVVSGFEGHEAEAATAAMCEGGSDPWAALTSPTDLVLCPAACHVVYPLIARGMIPADGTYYEVQAVCFRNEPSGDPARMRSFRMHELVYVGTPEGAREHRARWLRRGEELLGELDLAIEVVVANDPFFGRTGKLLAQGQREKELKHEFTAPISSHTPGAISSVNYHEDHFGTAFGLTTPGGDVAHSACFAVGLDRVALALIFKHGADVASWPERLRSELDLTHDRAGPG